ncbi:MAG: type II secretion system protein, partial [Acidimicrobiia bacterium]
MRTAHSGDRGFTLIESAVALLIAAFIFTALGQTVATALRASGERRLEQQASALTNEAVELIRDLGFDEVALLPAASDPTRLPVSTFDPGTGPENIYEDPAGGIPLQVTTETFNGITYTLTRYVTWVDDDPLDSETEDYKRFTVIADWTSRGVTRTEQLETFIALQSAEFGASNPTYGAAFNPQFDKKFGRESMDIVFLHTITNIGNRDDYFEMTITNDKGWPVTIRDAVTGLPLTDWTGEGTPDTGLLTPNPDSGSTLDVEIVVSVPAGSSVGEFSLTTMEATSLGDPGSSSSANDIAASTGT